MSAPKAPPRADRSAVAGDLFSEVPLPLLDDPLEYFYVEHCRARLLCAVLRRVAAERTVPANLARRIATLLSVDVPLHHLDETTDLYPVLRRRLRPEDELSKVIDLVDEDREASDRVVGSIVAALSPKDNDVDVPIKPRDATMIASYSARLNRQLATENGILLVFARKRLGPEDLRLISRSMKSRRGLPTEL